MPESKFVGRQAELDRLQQFLDRAAAGASQVVFIAGEAGSGKTALVKEFVRRAQAAESQLVAAFGECNAQTGVGDAYLPFREVLAALTTGAQGAKPAGKPADPKGVSRLKEFVRVAGETLFLVGPDLVGLFVPGASVATKVVTTAAFRGNLADKLAQRVSRAGKTKVEAALDQARIFEQYAAVLAALAKQRPLLLVLDDLHWADSGSLNLLFHLARKLADNRVMIVGTYRPDDVALGRGGERHPLEPILNEIQRYRGDVVVDLGAAQAAEGRAFVDALVDVEPNHLDAAFRQELFARTDGQALFTVELLRNLQERGDLVKNAEGRWVQSATLAWDTLPARVEGVIEERIGRLAHDLRDILNVGSVVGTDFTAQVIARVQQAQERELLQQLSQELERRHRLVQEEGEIKVGAEYLSRYRFAHALTQRYLYHELGVGERRLLHGAVAQALEALYAGQTETIVVQLARHYEEAGDGAKAAGYCVRAGDASAQAYASAEARFHYQHALEVLSALGNAPEVTRARVDVTIKYAAVAALADPPARFLDQLKEAEALAKTLPGPADPGDRARLAHLHYWLGVLHSVTGDWRAMLTYQQPLLQEAQEIGDEGLYIQVTGILGTFYLYQGRVSQAVQLLTPVCTYFEQRSSWDAWHIPAMGLAIALAHVGQVHEGVALAEKLIHIGQAIHDDDLLASGHLVLSVIGWVTGDDAEVLSAAQACVRVGEKTSSIRTTMMAYVYMAGAQSRLGLHELAAATLTREQQMMQASGGERLNVDRLMAMSIHDEVALNAGRYADAVAQAQQALALAGAIENVWMPGIAQRVWAQALAGSDPAAWEEVEQHFAASLRALESAEMRIQAANTHLAWGKSLMQHGNAKSAHEHFEQAAAQYEKSGLTQQFDEVRRLLATLAPT